MTDNTNVVDTNVDKKEHPLKGKKRPPRPTEKVKVSVAMVLDMLQAGKSREEIGKELGLTRANVVRMFKHPDLKGRKTHKADGVKSTRIKGDINDFVFVEDTDTELGKDQEGKNEDTILGDLETTVPEPEKQLAAVSQADTSKW